ncbi:MAG: hypothetical protein EAX86_05045 [Candidatus Heimdallarchaeota archaeon]|nr:hypothetical protein [Candidatus Heimdallarchaeota archaeon]
MTVSIKLSQNQKQVIVGLLSYPMSSDSFIAEKLGVKRSTFATVKKKILEPEGSSPLLYPINVPNFRVLGAELFSLTIAKLNSKALATISESDAFERLQQLYNVVKTSIEPSPSRALVILINRNYTDFTIVHHSFVHYYLDFKLLSPTDLTRYIISFPSGGFYRFLQYSEALANIWEIKVPDPPTVPIFNGTEVDISQISPLGWQVFDSLIRFPNATIVDLCQQLSKPRNTITRWVKKFQSLNLYQQRYIPDLTTLGFNIQLIATVSIQGLEKVDREKIRTLIQQYFSPTDLFLTYDKIIFFSIFHDYYDLREVEGRFFGEMNRFNLPSDLNKIVMSLDNIISLKDYKESFSSLVHYLREQEGYLLKQIS